MKSKSVKNYEGLYEVSDTGEVRSCDRVIPTNIKHVSARRIPGRTLKQNLKSNGYMTVDLCKNGKVTTTTVHRLVADAFVPNLDHKRYVNHIDSNRANNAAGNLEWVTSAENRRHGIDHGFVEFKQIIPVQCIETGDVFESSRNAADWLIANYPDRVHGKSKVVANNIRGACRGRTPKAYGFHWKYHEGSTTIPKGSTRKRVEMGSTPQGVEDIV